MIRPLKIQLIVMLMGAAILLPFFAYKFSATSMQTTDFCFTNNCFDVEIAKTPAQQKRGLMFRNHLDRDKGMFFILDLLIKGFRSEPQHIL